MLAEKELSHYNDIRAHTSVNAVNLEVLPAPEYSSAQRALSDADWHFIADPASRFYNLVLADCGAGFFDPLTRGVLSTVSGVVVVASVSIDGAQQASVALDWLRNNGYQDLASRACVVINHIMPGEPNVAVKDLVRHFEQQVQPGRVVVMPWDRHIAAGTEISLDLLDPIYKRKVLELRSAIRRFREGWTSLSAPAVAAGPTAAGATAARPATTRVTILTGRRMTDLVLPAAVPMDTYIDDTVAVLSEVLEDTPADVLGGFDFTAQGVWAFARPGSPPLKLDQSLDDAGVVDGSLLTLVSVSRTERYRPLVEDVIDAIAVLDESPEFDRTALNRFVGAAIPLLTAPVIGMAMRAWWETGRSLWWPLAIGILGIAVLVGSFVANRFYQSGHLAECLLVTTYLLIATAAALAVPLPRGVNSLGAPQVAGAATAVLFLTLMTRGGPRKRHELASFAVITAIAVIAAAAAFGYGYQDWVPAGDRIRAVHCDECGQADRRGRADRAAADSGTRRNRGQRGVARSRRDPGGYQRRNPDLAGHHRVGARVRGPAHRAQQTGQATSHRIRHVGHPDSGCRCHRGRGARALLCTQPGGRGFDHDRLRISLAALRRALVCVGVAGGDGRDSDGSDGQTHHLVPALCLAVVERLPHGSPGCARGGRVDGSRPARFTGRKTNSGIDRRRHDRCHHSHAAVDHRGVRHGPQYPVLSRIG